MVGPSCLIVALPRMFSRGGLEPTGPTDKCDFSGHSICSGSLIERKVDQDFRIKGKLIVVREVPAGVCQRCGEKVVRAEVGRQLAAIVTDKKSFRGAATIAVPVVAFKPGASGEPKSTSVSK